MMEESLAALEARIRDLDPAGPFTLGVRVALEEAVSALAEQNFGVGASLLRTTGAGRSTGEVIQSAHNGVFLPRFSSAAHAEMRLLDKFERSLRPAGIDLVLITTLEPCVMCLARILLSRVRRVIYLAADPLGGGLACLSSFPAAFQELGRDLVIEQLEWQEAAALGQELLDLGGDFVAKTVDT